MSDYHLRSARDLLAGLQSGDISACDLLAHYKARVENLNPAINAIIATDFPAAEKRAAQADAALARGENWGPLHGLPMTIKDAIEVAGLPCTGGAVFWKDHVPTKHAVAVQRLVDAGAIIFGKTNVPFLSSDIQSYNDVYGTTNNPWDPTRTCGGSSGGAAAAVAAGLTPMELGSDIGGSIRSPAHFCGVYGHKPTYGIVPKVGHMPPAPGDLRESDLSVMGPLGRTAGDLAMELDLVAGAHGLNAKGWQLSLPEARTKDPKKLRVAVWYDDPYCEIDKASLTELNKAAQALKDAGAQVDENARPDFTLAEISELYFMLLHATTGAGMPPKVVDRWKQTAEAAAPDDKSHGAMQARGGTLSLGQAPVWWEKREVIRAKWETFFQSYDVVLAPVVMIPAFKHDHEPSWEKRSLTVNGKERSYMDILIWAGPAVVSYLPATSAPVGLTPEGLPVNVQIIGPHLEDYTPIAVAEMLEKELGGTKTPPDFG
ncbi:MAG: amidase [Parvibaculaceae bacterium]|nr:amidase [Parvibaculaceae bacterium]